LTVGVRDIDPAISGILGMELLTSGWADKVNGDSQEDGHLNLLSFDFRNAANGTGKLLLDVKPTLDVVQNPQPWQNFLNPLDVDKNGAVEPADALAVIDDLNTVGSRALAAPSGDPTLFLDVNGDNSLTPIDALIIINSLNGQQTSSSASSMLSAHSALQMAVPEPSSWLLLVLGSLGAAIVHRFRRSR
jgi:hypothetical protein